MVLAGKLRGAFGDPGGNPRASERSPERDMTLNRRNGCKTFCIAKWNSSRLATAWKRANRYDPTYLRRLSASEPSIRMTPEPVAGPPARMETPAAADIWGGGVAKR